MDKHERRRREKDRERVEKERVRKEHARKVRGLERRFDSGDTGFGVAYWRGHVRKVREVPSLVAPRGVLAA